MEEIDLLTVGDASLDVFLSPTESETLCQLNDKEAIICFSYGDKIPVKNLVFSIGGNAANNSIGTKRLGIRSACVISVGDDYIGKQIVERLNEERVNINFVVQQTSTSSNYSTVINVAGERTIFTYKSPKSYDLPAQLPKVSWVYLTSMGDAFGPFYKQLFEWLKDKPDTRLAFNPGSRQIRAGTDAIRDILSHSYILYVNRKEAETIVGMENSQNKEKDLLSSLFKLGPKISIVTDGDNGSFAYDGARFLKCGILPIDAFERTGAGDSFGSGCLAALIKGKDLSEAMVWGTVNSASVIGYTGSQQGLLHQDELPTWLERAQSSGVKTEEF